MRSTSMNRNAFEVGQVHGWDSANYADSYGREESMAREAARRSRGEFASPDDRRAYRDGFVAGYEHFQRGEWPDGQPRDGWPCDELPWSCPTCGDDLGHCPQIRN